MTRKEFLRLLTFVLGGLAMPLPATSHPVHRAPALFAGHGSPMNAIETNAFTHSLRELGKSLEKPKAILVVSAHWTPPYFGVSVHQNSDLKYDFFGFPKALEEVQYPAGNAAFLLPTLNKLFTPLQVKDRGLDHGAWSVLVHLFPDADIPVMQLGIHRGLSLREHFEVGKRLKALREQGVMIIGSGNITHNLQEARMPKEAPAVKWAVDFDDYVKKAIIERDFEALIDVENRNRYTRLAHPTLEHYIPLLYVAGASFDDDENRFVYEGMEHGSLSMRSWLLQSIL
ncbi:4,5-DOPA dioxygenase extradiol [Sulfurimonas sp. HSL3-7]|uniref:4,5-DOPA-extradiol-dioxygenase n=1 Tax=Sulfonitrofixus jiaomeiensis TaxID=3131938 RepID=UPI0031F74477